MKHDEENLKDMVAVRAVYIVSTATTEYMHKRAATVTRLAVPRICACGIMKKEACEKWRSGDGNDGLCRCGGDVVKDSEDPVRRG